MATATGFLLRSSPWHFAKQFFVSADPQDTILASIQQLAANFGKPLHSYTIYSVPPDSTVLPCLCTSPPELRVRSVNDYSDHCLIQLSDIKSHFSVVDIFSLLYLLCKFYCIPTYSFLLKISTLFPSLVSIFNSSISSSSSFTSIGSFFL
ncbi:hypothetical protein GEMRC1_000722 [Eukaryota sp. GEM-RC1]